MIDLHTHSTASDGSDAPGDLVARGAEAGCSAIALSDHDTLAGLDQAEAAAAGLGVRLVRACEVAAASPAGVLHLLCYFVPADPGPLGDLLGRLRAERDRRNEELAGRLVALGLPLDYEAVVAEAGGRGVGRPHFAAVLVANGAARSIPDAFDRFLGEGGPGYVPRHRPDPAAVVEAAHASSAVCVLAHPLSLGLRGPELGDAVSSLARLGLDGLECHYGTYAPGDRGRLADLAAANALAATGGSDYHGTYKPGLDLGTGTGDLDVPETVLDALEEARARHA